MEKKDALSLSIWRKLRLKYLSRFAVTSSTPIIFSSRLLPKPAPAK